ncbi:dCTP deaminase [Skermanella rosea]|uniref:dCTP deaminase n=1 Tax=Skermanella rosea TaxID=1817965 RepID=UPI0019330263|nr:dCTP deaminase [Skermanella rosea]UEM01790.1 dCTP deaminase [Skermanella rosea]
MKLSDVDIDRYLAEGRIQIDPMPTEGQIGAMSVDLQLGDTFQVFPPGKAAFVDLAPPVGHPSQVPDKLMDRVQIPAGESFFLHPGELVLGITVQRILLPNDIAGRLDGRSSLARLGLMVHATAHTIDPGWNGRITLEFFNCGRLPLALRPGMRICALSFETLMSPTSKPYAARADAKYRDQLDPLPSRINLEQPLKD